MSKHCFVLEVRPGYEDEYKRRHDEIWPELAEDIRAAGFRNYSIWRHGLLLIGYFEIDDLSKAISKLTNSDANKRWGEYMGPIMKIEIDPATNFAYQLPCMWDLDHSNP